MSWKCNKCKVRILPKGFMCTSPLREQWPNTPAELPAFMLPRACAWVSINMCIYIIILIYTYMVCIYCSNNDNMNHIKRLSAFE